MQSVLTIAWKTPLVDPVPAFRVPVGLGAHVLQQLRACCLIDIELVDTSLHADLVYTAGPAPRFANERSMTKQLQVLLALLERILDASNVS